MTAVALIRQISILGLCLGFLAGGNFAQAQDRQNGQALAQQWCAQCHLVEETQALAGDTAPSFFAIANDPDKTSDYLTTWLTAPHFPMPDLQLGRREIADLVAYIQSLDGS